MNNYNKMTEKLYSFVAPLTQQQLEKAFQHYKAIAPELFTGLNPSFRVSNRLLRAFGCYNHKKNTITLSTTAHSGDLEDINRTLLHELAHARQFQLYQQTGDKKYLDLKIPKRHPEYSKYHGKHFFAITSEFKKVFGVDIKKSGSLNKKTHEAHLEQDEHCQLIFLLSFHQENKDFSYTGLLKMKSQAEDLQDICSKIHKQYFGAIASVDVYKASRHYHLGDVKQVLKDGTLKSPLSAIPIYTNPGLKNVTKELVYSTTFSPIAHGLKDRHLLALQAADSRRKKTFCDFAQQISRAASSYGQEMDFIANPAYLGDDYATLLQAAFASWQATPISQLSLKYGHIKSVAHNLYLVASHMSELSNSYSKEELEQNFRDRLHNAYISHCYPRHSFEDYKSAVIKQLKKWRNTEQAISLIEPAIFQPADNNENPFQAVRRIALEEMREDVSIVPLEEYFDATPTTNEDKQLDSADSCLQFDLFQ